MYKKYQVNVRTDTCLENLKVLAQNKKEAIDLATSCYQGYVRMDFVKSFKILSVIDTGEREG